jgi:hypothetical protein
MTVFHQSIAVAFVLVAVSTAACRGQPTVAFVPAQNSNGSSSGNYSVQLVSGKYNVDINKTYTDATSPFIINISAPVSLPYPVRQIDIGFGPYATSTAVFLRGSSAIFPSTSVDRIWGSGLGTANARLEVFMDGNLGADLLPAQPAIDGFDKVSLEIEGNVFSHVYTSGAGQNSIHSIIGDVEGDFVALNGNHRAIQVLESSPGVGGNLKGNVVASNGRIESLVVEGDIGASGEPVIISADTEIWYVSVPNGDVYANLSAVNILNTNNTDEGIFISGDLKESMFTLSNSFREDFIIDGGDIADSTVINALHLADEKTFWVKRVSNAGGSMFGQMHFSGVLGLNHVVKFDHAVGGLITFGGTINADIRIFGEPDAGAGLTGQIILNSADDAGVTWDSGDGDVTVGTDGPDAVTLSPKPFYNNKSVDIGGGAVGLVPYYCHYTDCSPWTTKVNEASDGLDGLGECDAGYHASRKGVMGTAVAGPIIRHYGEVVRVGTGKPFTVREKPIAIAPCDGGGNPNWTDVTSSFTITMHPGGDKRAYEIDGPFMPGNDDLIEPKVDNGGADYLACGGLASSTVGLHDYDFRYRVFVLQDLNLSGGLETGDITAWMAEPVDTTGDGVADEADLIDVTEAVATWGE